MTNIPARDIFKRVYAVSDRFKQKREATVGYNQKQKYNKGANEVSDLKIFMEVINSHLK